MYLVTIDVALLRKKNFRLFLKQNIESKKSKAMTIYVLSLLKYETKRNKRFFF